MSAKGIKILRDSLAKNSNWLVYLLILELDESLFYVKIGVSSSPRERLKSFDGGLPVDPVMLLGSPMSKASAYCIERNSHKALRKFSSRPKREWFKVPMSEKKEFFDTFNGVWRVQTGVDPDWTMVDKKTCRAAVSAKRALDAGGKLSETDFLSRFNYGGRTDYVT